MILIHLYKVIKILINLLKSLLILKEFTNIYHFIRILIYQLLIK